MSEIHNELKKILEAAMLTSDAPLTVKRFMSLFPREARPTQEEVDEAIVALEADCEHRGVEVRRIGGGFRMQTREQLAPWLRKLSESRPPRYSRALLETLAIIAYRQPVTRGDIEEIRGVGVSTEIMRTLLDREWVRQVGHRDVAGRPALYATSRQFLEYFNLATLKDLPSLMEKRDMGEIARELNLSLPFEDSEEEEREGSVSAGEEVQPADDGEPRTQDEGEAAPWMADSAPARPVGE